MLQLGMEWGGEGIGSYNVSGPLQELALEARFSTSVGQ